MILQESKQKIEQKVKEKYGKVKRFNFDWLYDFCELCENNNIPNDKMDLLLNSLLSDKNLERMENGNFLPDSASCKQEKSFFEYLANLNKPNKKKYIQNGLKYVFENITETDNIIDSFIKYIVLTNYLDIEIKSTLPQLTENNTANISCYIGGLEICHNKNIEISEDNNQKIMFEWLHTRKGLQGLKLGSLLFKHFFQEVHENFPDKDIVANNVMKSNTGAQRFYVRQGGDLFDVETDERLKLEDVKIEEKGNVGVLFHKEDLAKLSSKEIIPPQIDKKYIQDIQSEETLCM